MNLKYLSFINLGLLILTSVLCITVSAVGISEQNQYSNNLDYPEFVPGELFIRYNTGDSLYGIMNDIEIEKNSSYICQKYNLNVDTDYASLGLSGLFLVKASPDINITELQSELEEESSIKYTSLNYIRSLLAIPDDPMFSDQWGLNNTGKYNGTPGDDISAIKAWNTGTGSRDIIVAVLDSGIKYDHIDLADNMWRDPLNGSCGYNFLDNNIDPMDDDDHGTHCAGIIAATGNNNRGISGVAWKTELMAIKVSNKSIGPSDDLCIKGILWAKQHGADVISNSWGGYLFNPALKEAIESCGIFNVCAAGNENIDTDVMPIYPASFNSSNVISVAMSDNNDRLHKLSNYGKKTVHLAAPGENILSCTIEKSRPINNPVFFEPFTSLNNWTTEDNWSLDYSTFVSSPSSIYSGKFVNNTEMIITSKDPVSLNNCTDPYIGLYRQGDYHALDFLIDYNMNISISADKKEWVTLTSLNRTEPAFLWDSYKIPDEYIKKPVYIQIKLVETETPENHNGFWIDNLIIGDGGDPEDTYIYHTGTSMGTPQVSGAIALLSSIFPNAAPNEIKTALLSTVDTRPWLEDKCISGGRLNLSHAIQYLQNKNLVANFSASPVNGTPPLKVIFSDISSGSPDKWRWNFGDGSYSSEQNPVHEYTGIGRYTVTLEVSNTNETAILRKPVYININSGITSGPYGAIRITSNPTGSLVYIDDQQVGITPLDTLCVPIGSHPIKVSHYGYRDWNSNIIVSLGNLTNIPSVVLSKT